MKKYILIFRMDILTQGSLPSKEQMVIYMKKWDEWINYIASGDHLGKEGNHLSNKGKVLKPKSVITDGPYVSKGESVVGYITVLAKNLNDAVKLGKKCPMLDGKGTSVEIREILPAYK